MSEFIGEIFKNIFGDNVILATVLISMLPIIELRGGIPFGMSKAFWADKALSSWQSLGWSFLGSSLVVPILALLFLPIINWLKKTKLFKKLAEKIENMIKSKSVNIEAKLKKAEDESKDISVNQQNLQNDSLMEKFATENAEKSTNEILENNPSVETIKNENSSENTTTFLTKNPNKDKKYNKQFWIKFFGVMLFVAVPLPLTGVWTGTAISVMLGLDFKWTCLSVIIGNLIAGIIMQTICAIFPNFTNIILLIFLGLTILFIIFSLIKNKINKKQQKN